MSPEARYLLESLATVAAFGVVAWIAMAGLRRLGVRTPGRGPLEVVARVPLEGKRAIYLVRVGKRRVMVVGAGDAGLTRLGTVRIEELDLADAGVSGEAPGRAPGRSFREALAKVLRPDRRDSKPNA